MVFETERLIIGKITDDDVINLSTVLSDPEVMKHSTVGVHTEQQVLAYISNCQQRYSGNEFCHWGIYRKQDNAFVGLCGLNNHQVDSEELIHINYRLASKYHGNGYAVESVQGLLTFTAQSLCLKTVYALIESDNVSSVNVVKRTGFEFVKATDFIGFKVDVYQNCL
ncbi:GNAT family N-acetyltransferase [Colwellia psychrerythraea]|uniref:GCN5-related N-acetyltransferase n=1 Tax=Colwellia psychrerythraea TaxID=28229 RepID=A0A099KSM4_COLPS|nr:GNAT family N-acetyltransferase [Colwellia psychrerythraea]KGJ93779.1 GCN5-related N-acetyltransferase [Colwellia psychrerythraea]